MATRAYPGKRFGAIPELDGKITKVPNKGGWRAKGAKTIISNLTNARLFVAKQLGLEAKYPNVGSLATETVYTPARGYTKRSAKAEPTKAFAPTQRKLKQTDVYDSANRIYVRLPGVAEMSFPPNVSQKSLNATIKVVRATTRRRK